jgi:hypothetical protein
LAVTSVLHVVGQAVGSAGTEIEVRTFDGRWSSGFAIATVTCDGYLVRRHSHGSVLPVPFQSADIRPS